MLPAVCVGLNEVLALLWEPLLLWQALFGPCVCSGAAVTAGCGLPQVVQTEPLRFPEDVAVSAELHDLLARMLCKVQALAVLIALWAREAGLGSSMGHVMHGVYEPECIHSCWKPLYLG